MPKVWQAPAACNDVPIMAIGIAFMPAIESLADLLPQQWDALLPDDQPFLRHAFLSSLEDSGSLGPGSGWSASHRVRFDTGGNLCAAFPAYLKKHSYGEYVFDHAWADACLRAGIAYYPKLLAAVPFSPVSGPRLMGDTNAVGQLLDEAVGLLEEEGLSGLHVNFTDADSDAVLARRDGWLERLGCQFHWQNRGYRDFQDFLDVLASRKRKQMRKERALVSSQGITFEWRDGASLAEAEWDFVYACYATTYHVRGQRPYLTRAFFSLIAQRMPESVRVVFALEAGRPVAMAYFLSSRDTLYGRYWGCLAEYDRLHFETCFYQGMEYAIANGYSRFDAGAQGEHKLIRGFEPVLTRSWHYLVHEGLRDAVADYLEQERVGVQAYAVQAAEALPYRQSGDKQRP
jgi:predicted N-acyltransferase